MNDEIGRTYWG